MRPIYFIASYPRSGNTWVRSFFYRLMRDKGIIQNNDESLKLMDTTILWDTHPRLYQAVTGKLPTQMNLDEMAAARSVVHQVIAERAVVPPIIKTHAPFGLYRGRPTFNVKATKGAVYLVRDPRQVARSFADFFGVGLQQAVATMLNEKAEQGAHAGAAVEPWGSWGLNVKSWTQAADFPVLAIKYEDLKADPARWFARIASHAGLPASGKEIDKVLELLSLENMRDMARTGELMVPKVDPTGSFVGSQLEAAGDADAATAPLVKAFPDLMRRFGYL